MADQLKTGQEPVTPATSQPPLKDLGRCDYCGRQFHEWFEVVKITPEVQICQTCFASRDQQ